MDLSLVGVVFSIRLSRSHVAWTRFSSSGITSHAPAEKLSNASITSRSADRVSTCDDVIDQRRHRCVRVDVGLRTVCIFMRERNVLKNPRDLVLRQDMGVVQRKKQRLAN